MAKEKTLVKNSTTHNRAYIINTLYDDFQQLIPDETIEASLVKLGLITSVTRLWLKENYIDKQLSAKECAEMLGCSLGHIQKKISSFKLTKRKHGITTGNNQAHRIMRWKKKQQSNQPNRKEVIVFHIDSEIPLFTCPSITATALKVNIQREHIRDCLNTNKTRKTAGEFKFMLKKEWDEYMSSKEIIEVKNKRTLILPKKQLTSKSTIEEIIGAAKSMKAS